MRTIRTLLVAFLTVLLAGAASAQTNYPDRPIRMIVGFTAGSSTDITARVIAQKLSEAWSVPVTVENITGSSGSIGVDRVAKAAPDGYTLMWSGNAAITITPSLQGTPYDPVKDLAPISLALSMPSIFAVNNDVPAKTFQELIALVKKQPGMSYATPGVGTPQHIAGELLKKEANIELVHVPYRGAVMTDVLGGRVPITLQNAGAILPVVREKKLRGLAVTSLKPSPNLAELPTVADSGFPGFEAISWFGLFAPAGTPAPVIAKANQQLLKVLADEDVRKRFTQLGLDIVGTSPDQLAATVKTDLAKWAKVIKEAGIKVE
ncbi:MAG TPA: tripartite tricarboxylate transporter substrate binding protein [Xanthobacteraceae bacterium]|nr:tripartite tricarboxylate transporter substrate binding protein [Xanthobacteraceae bacterium]